MSDPGDSAAGCDSGAGGGQRPGYPCPACESDEQVVRAAAVPKDETITVVAVTERTRQAAGTERIRVLSRDEQVITLEPGKRLDPGLPSRPRNPLDALWTRARQPLLIVLVGLLTVASALVIGVAAWVAPYSGFSTGGVTAVRVAGTCFGVLGAVGLTLFVNDAWRRWHTAPRRAAAAAAVAALHQRAWYCRSCLAAYFDPADARDRIDGQAVIELEDYATALWRAVGYQEPRLWIE
jgi:hypothetical protein